MDLASYTTQKRKREKGNSWSPGKKTAINIFKEKKTHALNKTYYNDTLQIPLKECVPKTFTWKIWERSVQKLICWMHKDHTMQENPKSKWKILIWKKCTKLLEYYNKH